MQKIITRLLKKGNVAVGTQTEAIEGLAENVFDFSTANENEENNISAVDITHHESAHGNLHGGSPMQM